MIQNVRAVTLLLIFLILFAHPPTWSQDHPADDQHAGMSMSMPMPADGPTPALFLKWKLESEGNHHLIGLFVALGGVCLLAQDV